MDIGEIADAQPLIERAEAAVRHRAGHDAVADRVDRSPLLDADIDPTVESLFMIAAHLAEAAGDLVWTGKWRDRPEERRPSKRFCVELRPNRRGRGWLQREL